TTRRWKVDGIVLEARQLSSARDAPPGTVTARATMSGATVSVWGGDVRLAPLALHATTIVRNVDLAVRRAYLPPALPVVLERGVGRRHGAGDGGGRDALDVDHGRAPRPAGAPHDDDPEERGPRPASPLSAGRRARRAPARHDQRHHPCRSQRGGRHAPRRRRG